MGFHTRVLLAIILIGCLWLLELCLLLLGLYLGHRLLIKDDIVTGDRLDKLLLLVFLLQWLFLLLLLWGILIVIIVLAE